MLSHLLDQSITEANPAISETLLKRTLTESEFETNGLQVTLMKVGLPISILSLTNDRDECMFYVVTGNMAVLCEKLIIDRTPDSKYLCERYKTLRHFIEGN
jgi:hypothetical protein